MVLLFLIQGYSRISAQEWHEAKGKLFNINFTAADSVIEPVCEKMLHSGYAAVERFFGKPYQQEFGVFIHPDRHSMDSAWSKDWSIPGFRSECWMVASGVALKLDILSPAKWDIEACEHKQADTRATRKLLTHELVHVFHGQYNASPDFSNVEGIDWFVEGLAVWASGQYEPARISEVKSCIRSGLTPDKLDDFWTGKLKYWFSGTMVMYIDIHFGHAKLIELLPFNHKAQILEALGISEKTLISGWKEFMESSTSF